MRSVEIMRKLVARGWTVDRTTGFCSIQSNGRYIAANVPMQRITVLELSTGKKEAGNWSEFVHSLETGK